MPRQLRAVLAVLLLAAMVRIVNVSGWPTSTDEGWTYWVSGDHHFDVIIDKMANDRQPPLHILMVSAWMTWTGDSRLALRFLGILGGLLAVALAYRIGADWFGYRGGLYGALLIAALKITVYYSQEIRHYSWTLFAVCLTTLLFLRYLRRPRIGLLLAYMGSVVFTIYLQYFGVLILFVQAAAGFLIWRGSLRQKAALFGAYVLGAILYSPWLPFLWGQRAYLSAGLAPTPTSLDSILATGGWLFGKEQLALAAALYVLGLWYIVRKHDASTRWTAQIMIVLSGIGLLLIMTLANDRLGTLQPRTLVYLAPMMILVVGYGLSLINERAIRNVLAVALIVFALNPTDYLQPRLNSHLMAQVVAADYSRGDLIILENGWDDYAFRYELLQTLGESAAQQIIPTLPWPDHELRRFNFGPKPEDLLNTLKTPLETHRRVWVINYLMKSQVIPLMDGGSGGFQRVITHDTSVGKQYEGLYGDNTIRAILYERPISVPRETRFGDLFALHSILLPESSKAGDVLHIDLWWSALKQPPLDYSVAVHLIDSSGTVRVQQDGPPGDKPTSQWIDTSLHFDRHTLRVSPDLLPGEYRISVQVYWFGDGKPLPVNNGETHTILGTVKIQ